ncbi:restriction endonuclease subunit S [Aeromonas caviae]|uniref:restriction endonuclease subunit S n=1 Tax=Aeromonas caviae TaxID=648 RepID=UPI00069A3A32|nr:restriction endonuclease subunit S [Aeromonas caviae]
MVPNGWKLSTIEEIANVSSGGTPSRKNDTYWNGNIPWVTTAEVQFKVIKDTSEKITEEGLANSSAKLFPVDTILMAMYGQGKTRGQVAKLGIEASTNQACAAIVLHPDYEVDYYYQFLVSQYENIREMANSGGQENLSGGIVKSIQVPVPPLPEQQKIAKILSTWDQAISTTEQLLANSQQQKKALMQQLLTGKKRLLDKNGVRFSGEWKAQRIGSLLKEVKRPVQWDDDSEYHLLSVKRRSEGVVLREILKGSDILTKKMNTALAGDFLISKMQVVHGATGLVTEEFNKCHISDSYIALRPKDDEKIDIAFFSWFSKQKIMYHKAFLCSYGVHIEKMTFNFNMFIKEKVVIPASLEEQKKISTILSTAEQEISALQKKLSALKQEKKALMQQLLTGKRRVKVEAAA